MVDKSQELALALFREAKEKGTLDPSVEAGLTELIGAQERPKIKELLKTPASAETEKPELTPEQVDGLVSTLKSRFELPKNKELRKTLNWEDAEKAIRANAEEISHLEESGGEPQVVGVEGDEYIIEDRSAESPSGRRNLNFEEADTQRKSFGESTKFQSEDSYRAMQKTGKYDLNTWSWLEPDDETREAGNAMNGNRNDDDVSERKTRIFLDSFPTVQRERERERAFILLHSDREKLNVLRELTIGFLGDVLKRHMNPKNDDQPDQK